MVRAVHEMLTHGVFTDARYENAWVWDTTAAHLNHVPAILVVLGVAGLLFGLAPRFQGLSRAVVGTSI